jgi:hypothetical protein
MIRKRLSLFCSLCLMALKYITNSLRMGMEMERGSDHLLYTEETDN